jgi:hypothetical protein
MRVLAYGRTPPARPSRAPAFKVGAQRYRDAPGRVAGSNGTQWYLVVALALLVLSWLRPFTRARLAGGDIATDIAEVRFPAADVTAGERVTTWLMLLILVVGGVALVHATAWTSPKALLLLAVFPLAVGVRAVSPARPVEEYIVPTIEVVRPVRAVFLVLAVYGVIAGLTARQESNRVVLLGVTAVVLLGAFLDGLWQSRPARRAADAGGDVVGLDARVGTLEEAVRAIAKPRPAPRAEATTARREAAFPHELPTWWRSSLASCPRPPPAGRCGGSSVQRRIPVRLPHAT